MSRTSRLTAGSLKSAAIRTRCTCQAPAGPPRKHPHLFETGAIASRNSRLAFCHLSGYRVPVDWAWITPQTLEKAPWQRSSTSSRPPSHCSSEPPRWRHGSREGFANSFSRNGTRGIPSSQASVTPKASLSASTPPTALLPPAGPRSQIFSHNSKSLCSAGKATAGAAAEPVLLSCLEGESPTSSKPTSSRPATVSCANPPPRPRLRRSSRPATISCANPSLPPRPSRPGRPPSAVRIPSLRDPVVPGGHRQLSESLAHAPIPSSRAAAVSCANPAPSLVPVVPCPRPAALRPFRNPKRQPSFRPRRKAFARPNCVLTASEISSP